jgi:hypothetical protein
MPEVSGLAATLQEDANARWSRCRWPTAGVKVPRATRDRVVLIVLVIDDIAAPPAAEWVGLRTPMFVFFSSRLGRLGSCWSPWW